MIYWLNIVLLCVIWYSLMCLVSMLCYYQDKYESKRMRELIRMMNKNIISYDTAMEYLNNFHFKVAFLWPLAVYEHIKYGRPLWNGEKDGIKKEVNAD